MPSLLTGRAWAGDRGISIGSLYNQTGELSSIDVSGLMGMQLAAAQAMIDSGVVAISGLNDSDSATAAGDVAQQARIPFMTAGATLPSLPEDVGDFFFMACYGDNEQAQVGALFASQSLQAQTAWVLYDTTTLYTNALAGYFRDAFAGYGGAVLAEDTFSGGDVDYSRQIAHLSALAPAPDVLYVSAYPSDGGVITLQLRQAGFSQAILSGDGFDTLDLIGTAGAQADGVYFTTHVSYANPDPVVQSFVTAYRRLYGDPPDTAFAALGRDALYLLAEAIDRAGSTDPVAIRNALAQTRDFPGVTGTISYNPGMRRAIKPVTVVGIQDSQPNFVQRLMPSCSAL